MRYSRAKLSGHSRPRVLKRFLASSITQGSHCALASMNPQRNLENSCGISLSTMSLKAATVGTLNRCKVEATPTGWRYKSQSQGLPLAMCMAIAMSRRLASSYIG